MHVPAKESGLETLGRWQEAVGFVLWSLEDRFSHRVSLLSPLSPPFFHVHSSFSSFSFFLLFFASSLSSSFLPDGHEMRNSVSPYTPSKMLNFIPGPETMVLGNHRLKPLKPWGKINCNSLRLISQVFCHNNVKLDNMNDKGYDKSFFSWQVSKTN